MQNLLGCSVPDSFWDAWSRRIVFEREPIYVCDQTRSLLPPGTVFYTRSEFAHDFASAPLDLRDAYGVYGVSREAVWVALLSPAEFRALSRQDRQTLLQAQWRWGRGQIYDEAFIKDVLRCEAPASQRTEPPTALVEPATFHTPDGVKVALHHDIWWALPPETRRRWLVRYVSEGRSPCISSTLDEDEWESLIDRHGPFIRRLAGTFAPRSGPNCFSTTLAAATRSPGLAASIASLWLHQEPFLLGLAERGRVAEPLKDVEGVLPGSVLVWSDTDGKIHHACYALGNGLALNKDSQSWRSPRQILPLQAVLEDWKDTGLSVIVYSGN